MSSCPHIYHLSACPFRNGCPFVRGSDTAEDVPNVSEANMRLLMSTREEDPSAEEEAMDAQDSPMDTTPFDDSERGDNITTTAALEEVSTLNILGEGNSPTTPKKTTALTQAFSSDSLPLKSYSPNPSCIQRRRMSVDMNQERNSADSGGRPLRRSNRLQSKLAASPTNIEPPRPYTKSSLSKTKNPPRKRKPASHKKKIPRKRTQRHRSVLPPPPPFNPSNFQRDYVPPRITFEGEDYDLVVTGVRDTGLCGDYWGGSLPSKRRNRGQASTSSSADLTTTVASPEPKLPKVEEDHDGPIEKTADESGPGRADEGSSINMVPVNSDFYLSHSGYEWDSQGIYRAMNVENHASLLVVRVQGNSKKNMAVENNGNVLGVVVSGEITLAMHTTDEGVMVGKGDTFHIPSSSPYTIVNETEEPAEITIFQFKA